MKTLVVGVPDKSVEEDKMLEDINDKEELLAPARSSIASATPPEAQ